MLTRARTEAQTAWQQADAALREASKLVADFQRLEEARQQLRQLHSREKEVAEFRKRIDLARAAAKITPVWEKVEQWTRSRSEAETRLQASAKARQAAKGALEDAKVRFEKETARDPERDAASAAINRLESYAGRAEVLQSAITVLEKARTDHERADEVLSQSSRAVREEAQKGPPLRAEIARLEKSIGEAAGIDAEVQRLKSLLRDREDLARAEQQERQATAALEKAEKTLEAAQEAVGRADRDHKRLQQRWHQGQAALLARELKEGDPCPVCGSTTHPNPAASAGDAVSEDELEAAAQTVETARQRLLVAARTPTGHRSELQAVTRRKDELMGRLGEAGQFSVDEMRQQLVQAEAAANALAGHRERLEETRVSLSRVEGDLARMNEALAAAQDGLHRAQTTLAEAEARHELAEQALPEAYRGPGKLEEALAAARARLDALNRQYQQASQTFQETDKIHTAAETTAQNALESLTAVEEELGRAGTEWADSLARSVFATEQEVRLATVAEADLEQLESEVRQFEQDRIACSARMETLEAQLAGKEPADVSILERAAIQAVAARDEASDNWDRANQQLGMLKKTWKNLQARLQESKELDARFTVVGTLADVACGYTGAKISLQRYVLGKLLEDVLVEASLRLQKMSAGRYQLFRKQDPSKGRRASGLDLEVYDDYAGESRSVATLSGGESFMAALSLALGLSDVVQAQSGGIRLDTLFVDEGFGTLDSEALELAVSTLMDLQRSGRMVGVISHVAELKEQMDVRIDISKSQRGSSLKLISPMTPGGWTVPR
jgi:exonuclease SbcC